MQKKSQFDTGPLVGGVCLGSGGELKFVSFLVAFFRRIGGNIGYFRFSSSAFAYRPGHHLHLFAELPAASASVPQISEWCPERGRSIEGLKVWRLKFETFNF